MSVGQRHDSDRELAGQGLANLVAPLFGGIPATAAIARTAVNVRSGATSRLAALTHALVLLVIVLVAARWVGEIPRAALAGVLIATAVQMVRVSSLAALLRSTPGDAAVLTITAVATVTFDLVTAVLIGLVVAGFFALRQTAGSAHLEETPLDEGGPRRRGALAARRAHRGLPPRRPAVLRRRARLPARARRRHPGPGGHPAHVAGHGHRRDRRAGPRRHHQPPRAPRHHRAALRGPARTTPRCCASSASTDGSPTSATCSRPRPRPSRTPARTRPGCPTPPATSTRRSSHPEAQGRSAGGLRARSGRPRWRSRSAPPRPTGSAAGLCGLNDPAAPRERRGPSPRRSGPTRRSRPEDCRGPRWRRSAAAGTR